MLATIDRITEEALMERFPFAIHYVDLADRIWVVAFAHTSRAPNYWTPRLESES